GIAASTIGRGLKELAQNIGGESGRLRRPGGGRKPAQSTITCPSCGTSKTETMPTDGIVTLHSRVQHGAEGSPGTGHASRWAHVSWRQISKASDRIARWAWATR
ncbi:MAG: hypothetical protein WCD87_22310, partial [Pseudolabrys sp.]